MRGRFQDWKGKPKLIFRKYEMMEIPCPEMAEVETDFLLKALTGFVQEERLGQRKISASGVLLDIEGTVLKLHDQLLKPVTESKL